MIDEWIFIDFFKENFTVTIVGVKLNIFTIYFFVRIKKTSNEKNGMVKTFSSSLCYRF